eukprot:5605827-Pleurochrysis_carterae.AAC.1
MRRICAGRYSVQLRLRVISDCAAALSNPRVAASRSSPRTKTPHVCVCVLARVLFAGARLPQDAEALPLSPEQLARAAAKVRAVVARADAAGGR